MIIYDSCLVLIGVDSHFQRKLNRTRIQVNALEMRTKREIAVQIRER